MIVTVPTPARSPERLPCPPPVHPCLLVVMRQSTTAAQIGPSTLEQQRAWDGERGSYWVAHAKRYDEGVAAYHAQFLTAAAIDTTARVLDIGCGTGQATRDAARIATAGSVFGVDLSSQMIEVARRLAKQERLANMSFEQADAQTPPLPNGAFDIALSRHGVMFFGDARAAFTKIARALRPGGRLALLTWQPFEQNEFMRAFSTVLAAGRDLPPPAPESPGPVSFSDPDLVRHLLASAGFVDVRLRGLCEPMYFGPDPDAPVSSSVASSPGWCATSTPTPEVAHSRACELTWPFTRGIVVWCTTRWPGWSRRGGADRAPAQAAQQAP